MSVPTPALADGKQPLSLFFSKDTAYQLLASHQVWLRGGPAPEPMVEPMEPVIFTPPPMAPPQDPVKMQGFIVFEGAKGTVWANGKKQEDANTIKQIDASDVKQGVVVKIQNADGSTTLQRLKPGQTYDPALRKIIEKVKQ